MNWLIFIVGMFVGAGIGVFALALVISSKNKEKAIERDANDPLYRWARYTYLQLELAHDQKLFSGWTPIELIIINAPDEVALPSVTDRMYGCN